MLKHPISIAQIGPDNATQWYWEVLSLKQLFWKPFCHPSDPAHLIITPQRWRVLELRSQQIKPWEEAWDVAGTGEEIRWKGRGGKKEVNPTEIKEEGVWASGRTGGRADGRRLQVQAANPNFGSHMIATLHKVSQTEAQTEWERMTGSCWRRRKQLPCWKTQEQKAPRQCWEGRDYVNRRGSVNTLCDIMHAGPLWRDSNIWHLKTLRYMQKAFFFRLGCCCWEVTVGHVRMEKIL